MSIEMYKEWMNKDIAHATVELAKKKEKIFNKIPITSYVIQEYLIAKTKLETLQEAMRLLEQSERWEEYNDSDIDFNDVY